MTKAKRKNVVTPWGRVHDIPGANPEIVALLDGLLKQATAGGIKGLAVAYVDGANAINSDWNAGSASGATMMGCTTQLWFMMLKRKYEDD